MSRHEPPTRPQLDLVDALRARVRCPQAAIESYAAKRFGKPWKELTRGEVSQLIDQMQTWSVLPADLQRELGQQDLPGLS